jgi:hypothetical protein
MLHTDVSTHVPMYSTVHVNLPLPLLHILRSEVKYTTGPSLISLNLPAFLCPRNLHSSAVLGTASIDIRCFNSLHLYDVLLVPRNFSRGRGVIPSLAERGAQSCQREYYQFGM